MEIDLKGDPTMIGFTKDHRQIYRYKLEEGAERSAGGQAGQPAVYPDHAGRRRWGQFRLRGRAPGRHRQAGRGKAAPEIVTRAAGYGG
jgi:hypothetical protein